MRRLALAACAASMLVAIIAQANPPAFVAADADKSAAMKADVNARQPDGSTALQWAAYEGRVDEVRRLIKAGADVNARNDFGASAMSLAAAAGDAAILRELLRAGADPESPNTEGQTALMAVARTGRVDAARELLKAGANVNAAEHWGGQTALMWASAQRQPEMVRVLVKAGANVEARSKVTNWARKVTAEPREKAMDRGGFSPLHYAVREGCIECIRALVAAKADIDGGDGFDTPPLVLALMNLRFDAAKVLVDLGADVNLWDFQGQTPLYAAIDMNTVPTGGRADVRSTDELTGLDLARLLLDKGANVNAQLKLRLPQRLMPADRNGDFRVLTTGATPLMRAAVGCDVPAMKLLLERGALVDLPIVDGTTPFFGVVISASTRAKFKTEDEALEALAVLKAAGANPRLAVGQGPRVLHIIHLHTIDHARVAGSTALMMAVVRDWKRVVRQLAEWGVDLDAKDADGLSALDYAQGRERFGFLQVKPSPVAGMADLLRSLGAKAENTNAPAWPPLSVPQITARVPEVLY
ncbi:MAG: ankyrin repeat domain-containing protein [Steroidobacteraceae bacterium]